jgi:hypothetical protein
MVIAGIPRNNGKETPRYLKPNNVSMGNSALLLTSENKITHISISHMLYWNVSIV